ncbi:MAG: phosphoribosyltransferase [Gemmatimonadetes bacterium]|nr:phosphoribosyltransferase [Gemmatimonadota bacterium]MBK7783870.1 phosphoribosyltransferase [Gemmatimonadota bacterium]MBK9068082.1 phosphoribosyltransferase [Gemmatimonadota bacterium]
MLILTRAEAGRRLAVGLGALVQDVPVVVALSAGGARVASEVARALEAPLDVIAVCRLEVPGRAHGAFGAVADGAVSLESERLRALDLPPDYTERLVAEASRAAERLARSWRGGAAPVPVAGRTVILTDDGLAEAITVIAAARALRDQGAVRVIFAAPSASRDLVRRLDALPAVPVLLYPVEAPAAAMICDPTFEQTTGGEVGSMVRHSRPGLPAVLGG